MATRAQAMVGADIQEEPASGWRIHTLFRPMLSKLVVISHTWLFTVQLTKIKFRNQPLYHPGHISSARQSHGASGYHAGRHRNRISH